MIISVYIYNLRIPRLKDVKMLVRG